MALTAGRDRDTGHGSAWAAARAQLGLVAALFAVAALAWIWSIHAMRGMDAGPWTSLGGLAWFLVVWTVMMAAMMFPSVAPTVALYVRATRAPSPLSGWLFAGGYLASWAVAGLIAYALGLGTSVFGDTLAWDHAGRALAAVTLIVAGLYQLTPLKDVCLAKCRSPLGSILGSWQGGPRGAFSMGARNGVWCVACCWALMASLFALGIMSVTWMAVVAGIIAAEKTMPWRRATTYATVALLIGLGILLLVAPGAVPGLTIPGGQPMRMG
jgi:predicted metal-binding membrane protein